MNNSERKEILKTVKKIRDLVVDLKFVNPQLPPYGIRFLYTNDICLPDVARFKLNNPKSLINKYIFLDDYRDKVLAIYHTTNEYTIFKILNIKFGRETKANWLKLLSMFEINLTDPAPFNDLQCEFRKLNMKLDELSMLYERLKDNVLQDEIEKVETILKYGEEIYHLLARPKTQKLLDAIHRIEDKYITKEEWSRGRKYPFEV